MKISCLKLLQQKIFLTPSLIGSMNGQIFPLTNHLVVLIRLTCQLFFYFLMQDKLSLESQSSMNWNQLDVKMSRRKHVCDVFQGKIMVGRKGKVS